MAGLGVPALVCALLILLATGLPAAFAGPIAGPISRPSMTPAARAGPAGRVGPLPRRRDRLDDAGQDIGRALWSFQAGTPGRKARFPSGPFVPMGMNPGASPAETRRHTLPLDRLTLRPRVPRINGISRLCSLEEVGQAFQPDRSGMSGWKA
jgi:hypothetical protein